MEANSIDNEVYSRMADTWWNENGFFYQAFLGPPIFGKL